MSLRRAVATCAVACLGGLGLAGCDDGPPAATDGGAEASRAAEASDSPHPTYVALGDSYTAAPGVPQTDTTTDCLRSNGNYPNLVAKALGASFVDVSCSGATTLSMLGSQRTRQHSYPPQLDALRRDTSLVTLGIGGNDVGLFQSMVAECAQVGTTDPEGAPCERYFRDAGQHGDLLLEKIAQIRDRVVTTLREIHQRSPRATVVLVGYPQLVPARGTCRILPLAKGDYHYVRSVSIALDDALRTAAKKGKAAFLDVMKASKGHDICAGRHAWVNGNATDLARALAYHPFAVEQQAVADLMVDKLA